MIHSRGVFVTAKASRALFVEFPLQAASARVLSPKRKRGILFIPRLRFGLSCGITFVTFNSNHRAAKSPRLPSWASRVAKLNITQPLRRFPLRGPPCGDAGGRGRAVPTGPG